MYLVILEKVASVILRRHKKDILNLLSMIYPCCFLIFMNASLTNSSLTSWCVSASKENFQTNYYELRYTIFGSITYQIRITKTE